MTPATLVQNLENAFSGNPWYGAPVQTLVDRISDPNVQFGDGNSSGQILEHLIAWRQFAVEKLRGNDGFDIELNSRQDWNRGKKYSSEELTELKAKLQASQTELIALLRSKTEEELARTVPGRKYNFSYLIEGIIQHDIYHAGQLAVLGA